MDFDQYLTITRLLSYGNSNAYVNLAGLQISTSSQQEYNAVITVVASNYTVGHRHYCFHARDNTVTSGELWEAQTCIWAVSLNDVITKVHVGLELVHVSTSNGEKIEMLIVDKGGNVYLAEPVYTTVDTTYSREFWVNAVSGSDANTGLSASSAKLTFSGINSVIRSNWVTSGEHILYASGDFYISAIGDNIIWNHTDSQNGGGSNLNGGLTWKNWGSEKSNIYITADNITAVSLGAPFRKFVIDGVNIGGPFTITGADHFASLILINITTASNNGQNFIAMNCTLSGARDLVTFPTTSVSSSNIPSGSFDWISFEKVYFGDTATYHFGGGPYRYQGLYQCTFGKHKGDGTGSSWRCNTSHFVSQTSCVIDRSNCTWQANNWRLNGGGGTHEYDASKNISVYKCSIFSGVEGFEIDTPNDTTNCHISGLWFDSCYIDPASAGAGPSLIGANWGGASSFSQDIAELRISNCWGKSKNGGNGRLFSIETSPSSVSRKIRSIMLDGNTWFESSAGGFFTRTTTFAAFAGNSNNYENSSISILSNYAYCNDLDGGSDPVCFISTPGASKIKESDYNIYCKAATSEMYWDAASSLATWTANTGFDTHSSSILSASSPNMVSIAQGTFNARPASSSGYQIGKGHPSRIYLDADGGVRGPVIDCGAFNLSSTGSPPIW